VRQEARESNSSKKSIMKKLGWRENKNLVENLMMIGNLVGVVGPTILPFGNHDDAKIEVCAIPIPMPMAFRAINQRNQTTVIT